MAAKDLYYLERLKEEFELRKRKNPSISLRAFAKQIGLAAPVLSEVLKRKRGIPQMQLSGLTKKLALSPTETQLFHASSRFWRSGLSQLAKVKIPDSDYELLDEERNFRIIAEWEYYAVFELVDTVDFSPNHKWIASRLDISEERARIVLEHLIEAGLLIRGKNQSLRKSAKQLTTSQDVQSAALRRSHKETLSMAATKLETVSLEDRFYSSSTVPIDKERLSEAKELVREFRKKLSGLLSKGKPSEVYQFAFQLFPLTTDQKKRNLKG